MENQETRELSQEEMSQVVGGSSELSSYFTYLMGKYHATSKDALKRMITPEEYAYWEYLSLLNEGKHPKEVPCPAGYTPA